MVSRFSLQAVLVSLEKCWSRNFFDLAQELKQFICWCDRRKLKLRRKEFQNWVIVWWEDLCIASLSWDHQRLITVIWLVARRKSWRASKASRDRGRCYGAEFGHLPVRSRQAESMFGDFSRGCDYTLRWSSEVSNFTQHSRHSRSL